MANSGAWALNLFGCPKLTNAMGREANLPRKAFVLALRLVDDAPSMRLDRGTASAFLWPHSERSQRQGNLRALGNRIRAAQSAFAASPLLFGPSDVTLDVTSGSCDVLELRKILKAADAGAFAERAEAFSRPLLEGFDDESLDIHLWLSERQARISSDIATLTTRTPPLQAVATASRLPVAPTLTLTAASIATPLLFTPPQPICDAPELGLAFPTLVDDLVALLWKARTVRVALRDRVGESEDPAYRLDLRLRGQNGAVLASRLVHTRSGEIVWADRAPLDAQTYDKTLSYLTLAWLSSIERHQIALSLGAAEGDLSPFVLVAKAERDLEYPDLPALRRARKRFRLALQSGSRSARAYAGAARSFWLEWVLRAGPDPSLLDVAEDLARKAIASDPDSSVGYRELGMIASYRRRPDAARKLIDRAAALAPDSAPLRFDLADLLVSSGDHALAIGTVEALADQGDMAAWILATGKYMAGDYQGALRQIEGMKFPDPAWRVRLMCLGMLGRRDEAARAVAEAREFHPDFKLDAWLEKFPIAQRIDREHVREGFARSGFV